MASQHLGHLRVGLPGFLQDPQLVLHRARRRGLPMVLFRLSGSRSPPGARRSLTPCASPRCPVRRKPYTNHSSLARSWPPNRAMSGESLGVEVSAGGG